MLLSLHELLHIDADQPVELIVDNAKSHPVSVVSKRPSLPAAVPSAASGTSSSNTRRRKSDQAPVTPLRPPTATTTTTITTASNTTTSNAAYTGKYPNKNLLYGLPTIPVRHRPFSLPTPLKTSRWDSAPGSPPPKSGESSSGSSTPTDYHMNHPTTAAASGQPTPSNKVTHTIHLKSLPTPTTTTAMTSLFYYKPSFGGTPGGGSSMKYGGGTASCATTTPTSCGQSAWMTLPSSVRMATTATSSSVGTGVSWDPSAPASNGNNNGLLDSAMMTLRMPRRRNSFDAFPKPKISSIRQTSSIRG